MIKYTYTQAGVIHKGEIQRTPDMVGSHEVVTAVVQQIANSTGETVWFSMLNLAGTEVVGTNHAEPKGGDNTGQRTVEAVSISEDDGENWNHIHVRS